MDSENNKKPDKELRIPVLSFKRTKKSVPHNRNILAAIYGNLGKEMRPQKGTPLEYG